MYGNTQVGEVQDISIMLTQGGPRLIGNSIIQAFNINFNKNLPKTLQQLPQPGLKAAVDGWVAGFQPQPQKPGAAQSQPVKKP
jgi:hypothetical protein